MRSRLLACAFAAATSIATGTVAAEPLKISQDLQLIGFSGGSCTINVNPNSNATSLDLDQGGPDFKEIVVAIVNTACDYAHRIIVSSDNLSQSDFPNLELVNTTDSLSTVPYDLTVGGLLVNPYEMSIDGEFEVVSSTAPGNAQLPVGVTLPIAASEPGIYTSNVTFSVVID